MKYPHVLSQLFFVFVTSISFSQSHTTITDLLPAEWRHSDFLEIEDADRYALGLLYIDAQSLLLRAHALNYGTRSTTADSQTISEYIMKSYQSISRIDPASPIVHISVLARAGDPADWLAIGMAEMPEAQIKGAVTYFTLFSLYAIAIETKYHKDWLYGTAIDSGYPPRQQPCVGDAATERRSFYQRRSQRERVIEWLTNHWESPGLQNAAAQFIETWPTELQKSGLLLTGKLNANLNTRSNP